MTVAQARRRTALRPPPARGRRARTLLILALPAALLLGAPACNVSERRTGGADFSPRDADRLREDMRRMISAARDRVFPALVNIQVVTVDYENGKEQKGSAVGSGTIMSPDGYVVTNQHVTSDGRKFRCTLTDKREAGATLVGEDPLTDLAVLKLKLEDLGPDPRVPCAAFGDSAELEVGDYVMAMGSPFSLSRSVTLGIVSNPDRVFAGQDGADEAEEMELDYGQRTGLFTNWIQHDAAINPGNSGGPLVNLKGEVVGVNELGGDQLGFAIPSNLARTVVDALIQHGEVPRSDIGVSLKAIQRTGLTAGVLVNSVDAVGPAGKAGLRAGDVIVQLDGQPVTVRFVEQLPPLMKHIAELPIGAQLRVTYQRDGQTRDATIVTEKFAKDVGDQAAFRAWGLTAMQITDKVARDDRLDSTAGALVTSIRSGGPAATAEPPLPWGAVIRAVDGQPVNDLAGFIALYREIMKRDPLPEYLLLEFTHRGQNQVTLLKPTIEEEPDAPREVRKAWIGIATQPVLQKLAAKLGFEGRTGFRITRIYPHTTAAGSELRVGDILVGLNGQELRLRGLQDAGLLAREVRRLDIGATATLTVLRDGAERQVSVALEPTRLPEEEARRDRNHDFELTVRELTFFDRDANRWDESIEGVLVDQVEDAGWAGLGGIRPGDLIQQIAGQPVRSLAGYRKIVKDITQAQPERVVFVVLRGVRTHFQYVEPDWNPVAGQGPTRTGPSRTKE
jgi:serine protease Do